MWFIRDFINGGSQHFLWETPMSRGFGSFSCCQRALNLSLLCLSLSAFEVVEVEQTSQGISLCPVWVYSCWVCYNGSQWLKLRHGEAGHPVSETICLLMSSHLQGKQFIPQWVTVLPVIWTSSLLDRLWWLLSFIRTAASLLNRAITSKYCHLFVGVVHCGQSCWMAIGGKKWLWDPTFLPLLKW